MGTVHRARIVNGTGYDAVNKVAASEFTREQRRRLEAFTAAKALRPNADIDGQLRIAKFIETGVYR